MSKNYTRGKYFGGFACCARASVCVMSARALTLVRRARCVQELCPHVFTCTLHAVLTCTLHASKQRWPAPRCGPRVVFGQPTVRRWEHARPFPLRLASLPFCSALVRGGRGFSIADAAEEGGVGFRGKRVYSEIMSGSRRGDRGPWRGRGTGGCSRGGGAEDRGIFFCSATSWKYCERRESL